MVERYAPPSILISPDNKIVHLSEHSGRFLVHRGGELTASVFRLVREELRVDLQILLGESRAKKVPLDSRPIQVQFNEHAHPVTMHIRPALEPQEDGFMLVIFEEREPAETKVESAATLSGDGDQETRRIHELEAELNALHQRLQAVIEEYESSQEEMKASNKEMQSANEELRSTLEELETSKEELQSINEELQTVNQENRHKVEELAQLTGDLQNLLAATDSATLFLDRGLRILRFTPKLADIVNVRTTDRGRAISDFTHRLGYNNLRSDAESVLARLIPIERELQDDSGKWYLSRVLPYRSSEDRIEGVVITFIEITSRKRAEAALQQSEGHLRALVNATSDVAYRMNADWTQMKQLLGSGFLAETKSTDEKWLENYVPSVDQPRVMKAIADAIRTKNVFELEHRVHRADGSIGWALSRAIPLFDSQGEVTEWFGMATDATASKQTEAALRESETRLYSALEAAAMGTFIWYLAEDRGEPDGRMLALLGLPPTGDLTFQTFSMLIHPDDRVRYAKALADATDPRSAGVLRQDIRVIQPDGKQRWLAVTAKVSFEGDPRRPSYMAGAAVDISERRNAEEALRNSEERFRLFVENVREYALVQTDPKGNITSWNPGAERLFGYPSSEALGRPFAHVVGPEAHDDALSREIEAVSQGQRHEAGRWLTRKDGSCFWARWISEPVYDDNRNLRGIAKLMRDETEREHAEHVLRKALADKEALLKEVHHRVKNNLQVISSLLSLQAGTVTDHRVLALFEEARNRVQSIAAIHELLYESDALAGINLVFYTSRLVPTMVHFYGMRDRVAVEIDGDDDLTLELQRAVPYGLLLNELISNSLKHAFPGRREGKIRISINRDGDLIRLRFSDNGIGIPPDIEQTKPNSLGLRLIRIMARQIGATLRVTSESGTMVELAVPPTPQQGDEENIA